MDLPTFIKNLFSSCARRYKAFSDLIIWGGKRNNWKERISAKLQRDGFTTTLITLCRIPFTIKYRVAYRRMLRRKPLKDRFGEIYQKNFWGSSESGSGEGSEISYTVKLRGWLTTAIPGYAIENILDAACGDFNWMRLVVPKVNVDYLGIDIVEKVINDNKKKYENDRVQFEVKNICEDKLPACDLLLVRDVLFHFSNDEINKFLKNIAEVEYEYLLVSTHMVNEGFRNIDIVTGDFRLIDLFKEPFNFDQKTVLERVEDYPDNYFIRRHMILLDKKSVPLALNL